MIKMEKYERADMEVIDFESKISTGCFVVLPDHGETGNQDAGTTASSETSGSHP